MEIIDYFAIENPSFWLEKIKKCEWSAAQLLSKMLVENIFYKNLGCGTLYLLTDDTQPFMDAITTVPAFVAQILLTFRYREQWIFWSIINVGSIFMWANVHDYCMVAQYIFWSINCILGYYSWSKN